MITPQVKSQILDLVLAQCQPEAGGGSPPDVTAPAAPANLAATPGDATVALSWDANAEGDLAATPYTIYRSTTSGSGFSAIGTSATNSYNDNTAANFTTYYYVVTAKDTSNNESVDSSEVSAMPYDRPYVVTSGTDYHTSSSETWEFTLPEHEAGDILFMCIQSLSNVINSWSASTGWTAHRYSAGTDLGPNVIAMQWIRATDGATANPTINAIHSSNTSEVAAICYVIRGANASGSPIDSGTWANSFGYTTNITSPSMTPGVTGGLVFVHVFKLFPTSDTIATSPPPSGWSLAGQAAGSAGAWKSYGFTWDTLTTTSVATPSDVLYTFTGSVSFNGQGLIFISA